MSIEQTICCDLDGVLANIEQEMERRIKEHFGVEKVYHDKFYLEERFDVPKKEMSAFVQSDKLFHDENFWLAGEPYRNAIKKLQDWYSSYQAKNIFIVTGRHSNLREVTEMWLLRYNVPYTALMMDTLHEKSKVMKYVGADFMIEDRYDEAWEIAKHKMKCYVQERDYNLHRKTDEVQGRYKDNIIWIKNFFEIQMLEGFKSA